MLSDQFSKIARKTGLIACLVATTSLSACTFQPLYAPSSLNNVDGNSGAVLSQVNVSAVDSRVGQQVRNHLLFLLHGGKQNYSPRYEARLLVKAIERRTSAKPSRHDTTAGFVTVTASYSLIDTTEQKIVAEGNRRAISNFDRTSQIFANQRAVRDAENRAAIEVAENIRNAIASDLRR